MKNIINKKMWLVIAMLSWTFVSCGSGSGGNPVAPGGGAGGAVTVSDASPTVLTTFTVTVTVENVTDLAQAHLELSYDDTIIDVVDINTDIVGGVLPLKYKTFDDGVGGTGNLLTSFYNALDGSGPNFTGTGTLCTITFTALNVGATAINFSNAVTFYVYADASIDYPLLISQTISVQSL